MNLLTIVNAEKIRKLLNDKRLEDSSPLGELPQAMISAVKEFIEENTGFESNPVVCVATIFGEELSIHDSCDDLAGLVNFKTNEIILEVKQPDDCLITIQYEDLIEFRNKFNNANQYDIPLISEDFKNTLTLGVCEEPDTAIAFIPELLIKYCKYFYIIKDDWGTESTDTGNSSSRDNNVLLIENLNLDKLNLF